jgi:hypothetical protein
MADVPATLRAWSATTANNTPTDATTIGAGLADNLQEIQAVTRRYLASKGTNMASASTVDLSTADGYFIDITGTTTITSFGTEQSGITYKLRFTGALLITYNATSLITTNSDNIRTSNGDTCYATSLGSGNWIITGYEKKGLESYSPTLFLGGISGSNTITATATPTMAAYQSGQRVLLTVGTTNTGATTINIDSLGAKNVFANGVALRGWELVAGYVVELVYDGTQFHLVGGNNKRVLLVNNAPSGNTSSVIAGSFSTAVTAGAFDNYEIEVLLHFDTGSLTLQMESSTNGGSTYTTNSNIYVENHVSTAAPTSLGGNGSTGHTFIILLPTTSSNSGVYNSVAMKFHPSLTKTAPLEWQGITHDGTNTYDVWGSAWVPSGTNAFRVTPSGNAFSGTVKCWGVRG